jgi:DNA (cytosine-5)-methyltransferase 1
VTNKISAKVTEAPALYSITSPVDQEAKLYDRMTTVLEELYIEAEKVSSAGNYENLENTLGAEVFSQCKELASTRHASRGVALTLTAFKIVNATQDIRRHKAEQEGGFSARGFDSRCTVPFLERHSLPYNVESHWLSQTFSFAGPFETTLTLPTNPKKLGPMFLRILHAVESSSSISIATAVGVLILTQLIDARNRGRVALTRPKNLSIDQVLELLRAHFFAKYKTNAPRLPQVAIYALYECMMPTISRYHGYKLQPLERMKTANRKSGTVGDIDVNFNDQPIEAVEVKHGVRISKLHVAEAIQKIKSASVERYLILSTAGIQGEDAKAINELSVDFRKSNGCEIIVNGVIETIGYYLRLLRSTNDFVNQYTKKLEVDEDLDYEHRLAWNRLCAAR